VNPAIATVLAPFIHSPTTHPERMVREPMLRLPREPGHGSVFHPHHQKVGAKRTIVWSIQLRQSDGPTTNPDQTLLDPSFARAVRGSAAERGHHLHAHRVSRLSRVATMLSFTGRRLRL